MAYVPLPADPKACREVLRKRVPADQLETLVGIYCQQPAGWYKGILHLYSDKGSGPIPANFRWAGENAPPICLPDQYVPILEYILSIHKAARAVTVAKPRPTSGLGSLGAAPKPVILPAIKNNGKVVAGTVYNIKGQKILYPYIPFGPEKGPGFYRVGVTKVRQTEGDANSTSARALLLTKEGLKLSETGGGGLLSKPLAPKGIQMVTGGEKGKSCKNNQYVVNGWFPIWHRTSKDSRVPEGLYGRPKKDELFYYLTHGDGACYPLGPFPGMSVAQAWKKVYDAVKKYGAKVKEFSFSRSWGVPTEDMKEFALASNANALIMMSPRTDVSQKALDAFILQKRLKKVAALQNYGKPSESSTYYNPNTGWVPSWDTALRAALPPLDWVEAQLKSRPKCSAAILAAADAVALRANEAARVEAETTISQMIADIEKSEEEADVKAPPEDAQAEADESTPVVSSNSSGSSGSGVSPIVMVAGAALIGLLLLGRR